MSAAGYQTAGAQIMRTDSERAALIEQQMAVKFARWEELEQLRQARNR
jgi:hypothetical protein